MSTASTVRWGAGSRVALAVALLCLLSFGAGAQEDAAPNRAPESGRTVQTGTRRAGTEGTPAETATPAAPNGEPRDGRADRPRSTAPAGVRGTVAPDGEPLSAADAAELRRIQATPSRSSRWSVTVPQAVILSILAVLPLVAIVWALNQAKGTLRLVSNTLARNMSDDVANEIRIARGRIPPVQGRAGRGRVRTTPGETYEMRRTQQKTIHTKLDELEKGLSEAGELIQAIERMRSSLFSDMQAAADKLMNAVWADYQQRFKHRIDSLNADWRASLDRQKADLEAKAADQRADHEKEVRRWQEHSDGLNRQLSDIAAELERKTQTLETTAAALADTETERDRWRGDYEAKVDELTTMAESIHPKLYDAFSNLFAGLKAQVSAAAVPGGIEEFFSYRNNRFRTLYHLCLAMMSVREEIRRADSDETGLDDLKLEMRELFRHLDALVYEFREDDEVLCALREQLGAILNKTILSGIYECRWPTTGKEVDERYHYLNEIGGNLICEVKSGTLIDANSGEVLFKAVVDTGN